MNKQTKIVATISDKRCNVDFLKSLSDAGMNVVRMNSAHLDRRGFTTIVDNVREANSALAIMMDTKGPEIRTTANAGGEPIEFNSGMEVSITGNPDSPTTRTEICLNYRGAAGVLKPGNRLLIDDGELAFTVTEADGIRVKARAENDGILGSRKSVNIPGVSVDLPAVTDRDRENIALAVELGVDFIAHSFVRSAADVATVSDILRSLGSEIKIISKIENQEGIDNFDEILEASYGIMIARGDLGIEVAPERIPGIQLMMVNKCIAAHKPVIVATQMLHSMIEHPRPTRAEVSDVAGAVYQRADAVMLSGETAYGRYPVEAVTTMAKVAAEVEKSLCSKPEFPPLAHNSDVTSFLARQAVLSEALVGTKAILTDSFHGLAARYIASFRGLNPTIAICYNRRVQRLLALSFGTTAHYCPEGRMADELGRIISGGVIADSDLVAYLAGSAKGVTSLEIATMGQLASRR